MKTYKKDEQGDILTSILKYDDHKTFLKDYLEQRQKINQSFSLRAFAKKLGISPGYLSLVLQGKKHLSEKYALLLSQEVGFNKEEESYFFLLIDYHASSGEVKLALKRHVNIRKEQLKVTYYQSSEEKMNLRWEHLFLLALTEIVFDKEQLIQKASLMINKDPVYLNELFNDLVISHRIIETGGKLVRSNERVVFETSGKSSMLKNLHKNYLKQSLYFVDEKESSDRFSVTEFVEIPKDSLEDLKKISNDYLDQVSALKDKKSKIKGDILGISLHLNQFKLL